MLTTTTCYTMVFIHFHKPWYEVKLILYCPLPLIEHLFDLLYFTHKQFVQKGNNLFFIHKETSLLVAATAGLWQM